MTGARDHHHQPYRWIQDLSTEEEGPELFDNRPRVYQWCTLEPLAQTSYHRRPRKPPVMIYQYCSPPLPLQTYHKCPCEPPLHIYHCRSQGGVVEHYDDECRGCYVNDCGDNCLCLDLPQYNGNMHIEDFIDYKSEVERFFNYMDITGVRKVKLVALRFKGTTSVWWDQTIVSCAKFQKPLVRTWVKMKRFLSQCFYLRTMKVSFSINTSIAGRGYEGISTVGFTQQSTGDKGTIDDAFRRRSQRQAE